MSPEEVKQLASLIRTVVHLNFTHTPLSWMETICELQKLNGCPHMLAKYGQHRKFGTNATEFVSDTITALDDAELADVDFVFWSADCNTDTSRKHSMIMFLYYLRDGVLQVWFRGLKKTEGDAKSMMEAIYQCAGPSVAQKLMGAAVDGASVMTGASKCAFCTACHSHFSLNFDPVFGSTLRLK